MRSVGVLLACLLLTACSSPPARRDPVEDSFHLFVADAEARVPNASDGRSRRVRFGSGRGYTAAEGQTPATGTVSLHLEEATEAPKGLRALPAMRLADYELRFVHHDGRWEFKEGTVRHKLTETSVTSGQVPNVIEEGTNAIHSLDKHPLVQALFYGGKP